MAEVRLTLGTLYLKIHDPKNTKTWFMDYPGIRCGQSHGAQRPEGGRDPGKGAVKTICYQEYNRDPRKKLEEFSKKACIPP
jgi:hypothetical protein